MKSFRQLIVAARTTRLGLKGWRGVGGVSEAVRATVVGRDTVLAGDPKSLDYYVILI